MTESELDGIYTQLCKTMTELGEARCALFLARFALLAIDEIDGVTAVQRLIADASESSSGNSSPSWRRPTTSTLPAPRMRCSPPAATRRSPA